MKNFDEKKELKEVWNIIKGCSYFGWTKYLDMLDALKEYLRTRKMFFNNTDEERKFPECLDYIFKFYLEFNHSFSLMNQDHYTATQHGDQDATNNKQNIQAVFRFIYNYKMDHILGTD